jgi:hypothetical protein
MLVLDRLGCVRSPTKRVAQGLGPTRGGWATWVKVCKDSALVGLSRRRWVLVELGRLACPTTLATQGSRPHAGRVGHMG